LQNFFGNRPVADVLEEMITGDRITQTLLFSGPEGVGKATTGTPLRRTASRDPAGRIQLDDLSLESNAALITDREKWTSDKRKR